MSASRLPPHADARIEPRREAGGGRTSARHAWLRRPLSLRILSMGLVATLCVGGAALYALHAQRRMAQATEAGSAVRSLPIDVLPDAARRPFVLFRSTALGDSYGRMAMAYLDDAAGTRYLTPLTCERVHYAGGRGLCLEASRGVTTTYLAHVFDAGLAVRGTQPLAGPPSRARLSADGRYAAMTVFLTGHAYSSPGFSTRASIADARSGHLLVEDLESFKVLRDGRPFTGTDFNFWGVTFARDPRRFYATLGTGGATLLVQGDMAARTLSVIHDDVECPSVSPDESRIAFKRRVHAGTGGRIVWQIVVLELASGRETVLARETHNVDDQVEWLNERELVYALPDDSPQASAATNVWALAADGSGAPRLLVPFAFSPAVVR